MANGPFMEGATHSLLLTIKEIETVLEKIPLEPTGSLLREQLRTKISELSEHWYKRGFKRGCIESHKAWLESDKYPSEVRFNSARDFYNGENRKVRCKWKKK